LPPWLRQALLAPTAVVVSRSNDNDAHQDAAAKANPAVDSSPPVSSSARLQLVVNDPSFEACADGFRRRMPVGPNMDTSRA
jgi:hypothetical protein